MTCICCSEDISGRAYGTCQTCSEENNFKDGSLCQTCFDFHRKTSLGKIRKSPCQGHSFSGNSLGTSTEPSPDAVHLGGVAQGGGSASSSSSNPPVVACARHKAVALQREIETLEENTESTLREWDARRDAVILAARNYFDAGRRDITTTAAARLAALEAEAVAADCVLEKSIRVTRGLDEVRI